MSTYYASGCWENSAPEGKPFEFYAMPVCDHEHVTKIGAANCARLQAWPLVVSVAQVVDSADDEIISVEVTQVHDRHLKRSCPVDRATPASTDTVAWVKRFEPESPSSNDSDVVTLYLKPVSVDDARDEVTILCLRPVAPEDEGRDVLTIDLDPLPPEDDEIDDTPLLSPGLTDLAARYERFPLGSRLEKVKMHLEWARRRRIDKLPRADIIMALNEAAYWRRSVQWEIELINTGATFVIRSMLESYLHAAWRQGFAPARFERFSPIHWRFLDMPRGAQTLSSTDLQSMLVSWIRSGEPYVRAE